ncbi:unnamed protein product [Camellia sinensis]
MAKKHYGFVLILSIIIALGVVSFAFCIASEFKRTKRKDLKLDGKLCFLPGSHAFEYGIAALICLFVAQITGNLIICWNFCSGEKTTGCKAKSPTKAFTFLLLSWFSFGIAIVLISAATSMNTRQPYGQGWLDSECYIVKDGVYIGSAILVFVSIGLIIVSDIMTIRKSQVEEEYKVHSQFG